MMTSQVNNKPEATHSLEGDIVNLVDDPAPATPLDYVKPEGWSRKVDGDLIIHYRAGIVESSHGKGKLKGTKTADIFAFDSFDLFTRKAADKIIRFDSSEGDLITVSPNAFPELEHSSSLNYASTRNKK